jgi:hypothetical protein
LPGIYRVRLTVAGQQYTQPLKVTLDPRSTATPIDLAKQFDLATKISSQLSKNAQLTGQIGALRKQLDELKNKSTDAALLTLLASVDTAAEKIAGARGSRAATAPPSGLGAVQADLNAVNGVVDSSDRTPPAQAYALYEQAAHSLATQLANWEALKSGKLAELNRALRAQNLPEIANLN